MSFFDESFSSVVSETDSNKKSGKSKKNVKPNAFLMFLLEYRRKEQSRGNQMDMEEAQFEAGQIWQKMGQIEREKYEASSKSSQISAQKKFTSFGVSFDEIDRQKLLVQQQMRAMELTVEELLQTAQEKKKLKSLTFYFFSASCFIQTLGGDIFPAEIAMSKFNLKEGVYDSFHMMVNPGELPLGMASDALTLAKETHRRDLPPDIEGEKDYSAIYDKILDFIDVGDSKKKLPPIFVEPGLKDEEFKIAKMTLKKIAEEADKNTVFTVYPLEQLVFRLHKKCIEEQNAIKDTSIRPFMSTIVTKDMMARDPFMYSDIGCNFHREQDANALCCLSKVKRWGFLISKYCLDPEQDAMLPNRHFPEMVVLQDDEVQSTIGKDSGWTSAELTDSLKILSIDSRTSQPSLSINEARAATVNDSVASMHSIEITQEVRPSTPASDPHGSFSETASRISYSQMIRSGRSGRGGKREN